MTSGTFQSAQDALVAVLQDIFQQGSQQAKEAAIQCCVSFVSACMGVESFTAICVPPEE